MASIGTLLTFVQQARPLTNVLIPITYASIPRVVACRVIRNDHDPFANLPQPAGSLCKSQLEGTTVAFTLKPQNGVRIDGVPPACMTLANVFLGQDPQQPAAIPVGMLVQSHLLLPFISDADMPCVVKGYPVWSIIT